MGSSVHFVLLFSGLGALALSASRQFYVVEDKKSWSEAQTYCRENYTDLATIENQEEMNAVTDLLKEKRPRGNVWIGLRQNHTSWDQFKNVSWYWSDGALYNYSNWNYGEPNNGGGNNCVELYTNYSWNDAGCSHTNSFVCYKKRTPLIVIEEKKSWREALRFCRQNHVDLVSVYSQEMQDWVSAFTKNISSNLWIGLRHTCALGFWYWVRGEMICYQNWAPGNGSGVEDCSGVGVERTGALLSGSKKWVSLPQTDTLYFICITFQRY